MKKTLAGIAMILIAAACSKQEAKQKTEEVKDAGSRVAGRVSDAIDTAVPFGGKDDPAAREKERFDEQWRGLPGFREMQPRTAQGPAAPAVQVRFAPGGKETLKGLAPQAILDAPAVVPLKGDVSGPTVLKTQVYLDRLNFSVGALDGRWGRNSSIALWWYQRSRGIKAADPGALDEATFRALAGEVRGVPALVQYTITDADTKEQFVKIPEDVYDQAKLDKLGYESMQEKLAEQFHTTGELLELLNPGVAFGSIAAGQKVWVPNVRAQREGTTPDIARIVVSIAGNTFNAFDSAGNLVFHAPTTLGNKYDPSPRETLEVKKTTFDPWFHYQPTLFHEVPDEEPEANLAPGPNSPVGVVWIALSKPHYGIHGTSSPDTIGYASSHGCVRLTNWDAREVGKRVAPGVKVEFLDTRGGAKKSNQT